MSNDIHRNIAITIEDMGFSVAQNKNVGNPAQTEAYDFTFQRVAILC